MDVVVFIYFVVIFLAFIEGAFGNGSEDIED